MNEGVARYARHYMRYILIAALWMMFELRNRGGSIYLALSIAAGVTIPVSVKGVAYGQTLILFCCLSLVISTLVLTKFDFGQAVFFCFMHFEVITCLTKRSLYSIAAILAETICLYFCGSVTRYIVLLLGLNMFACLSICLVFDFKLESMFTGGSTFLAAFLSLITSKFVNVRIFLLSCFFSLPRLPLPIPPQTITIENQRSLVFAAVSFSLNLANFLYGVKYRSMSVQSGALKSMSNNAAMVGAVLADVCSRIQPNAVFSYGYGRTRVICKFTFALLLLYFSCERLLVSLTSLIGRQASGRVGMDLFSMNIATFSLNVVGVFFLGTIDPKTCTLSEGASAVPLIIDLSLSTSELLCTILSFAFGITVLDSYVSLATSATLVSLSIPRLRRSLAVLLEQSPVDVRILYSGIPNLDVMSCEAWELTPRGELSVSVRAGPLTRNPDYILAELGRRATALKAKYTTFEIACL